MSTAKPFWKSRTLWFNFIAAICGALPVVFSGSASAPPPQGLIGANQALDAAGAVLPTVEASLPLLRQVLPAEYYAWLAGIVVVGNIALRAFTQARLALKRPEEPK